MNRDDGHRLGDLFEDLEQQAAGLELAERDAEVADRARGEYSGVTFADRLHASVGRVVTLATVADLAMTGRIVEAGRDWCQLVSADGVSAHGAWLVRLASVVTASGLADQARPEPARPAHARLGLGSALHRLATPGTRLTVHLANQNVLHVGGVSRIGADFAEVAVATGVEQRTQLVRFESLVAVRRT